MNKIISYIVADIIRNRFVLMYTLLLALLSWSSFSLEDSSAKGMLTLLNIILLTVPLVSILFSTIYIYNSSEFIELVLSQPVTRRSVWYSLFFGLAGSLAIAFLVGAGIPLLIFGEPATALIMIAVGVLLTCVFVSLAHLCAVITRDRAKGIGFSVILWLYFALLFDGLVLFLLFQLSEYPIEKWMVAFTALSPIDLSRILVLLRLDASAMLGYTGAIFRDYFGTSQGMVLSFALLFAWVTLPFLFSMRKFRRKDL